MNLRILASAVFAALCACGLPETDGDEELLISDSEVSAIQTQEQASTSTPTASTPAPTTPGAFHLRLAWGYLSGNRQAPQWVNWTGTAGVTGGTMDLEHLVFFEGRDFTVPTPAANTIAWRSRTLPHFDGLVAKVTPGAGTDQVTITTPRFTQSFAVSALVAGSEQRFVVDADGHEVSVSSVPDTGCAGFSFGYMKQAPAGWLGFAGLVTNARGQKVGVLRFRSDNGVVQARLNGLGGALKARGAGTLDSSAKTFSVSFVNEDGTAAGTMSGLYADPSYSPRGSFQANGRCD